MMHLAPSLADYRDWLSAAALPIAFLVAWIGFTLTAKAPERFRRVVLALTHVVMRRRA